MGLMPTLLQQLRGRLRRRFHQALAPVHYRRAVVTLEEMEAESLRESGDYFAVPFRFKGPGIYGVISPSQVVSEVQELYSAICKMKPRYVCEIGTDKGGTLYLWCKAAADDAVVISVDLPSRERFSPERRRLYARFQKTPQQMLHFIAGDSHQRVTLAAVRGALGGMPLDFLFIDGDHSYEGVRLDYDMYAPLVRPSGLIALHDIHTEREGVGVPRFWEEIRRTIPGSREISAPWAGGPLGCGIGIIVKEG